MHLLPGFGQSVLGASGRGPGNLESTVEIAVAQRASVRRRQILAQSILLSLFAMLAPSGREQPAAIAECEDAGCWPWRLQERKALEKWAGAISIPVFPPVCAWLGESLLLKLANARAFPLKSVAASSPLFHLVRLAQLHFHTTYRSSQTLPRPLFLLPRCEAGLAVVHFFTAARFGPHARFCH